jgi:hypothetical protein
MVGELITLPLRIGIGATRLWLRATTEAVAVAADATGRLIDKATGNRQVAEPIPGTMPERDVTPSEDEMTSSDAVLDTPVVNDPPVEADTSVVSDRPVEADTPATAEAPPAEPVHVSEEPELVEEIAEPGAEDGAGASLHVREPWSGYAQMKAEDVIDRLAGSTPAVLAAIQLYENGNRGRVTVLDAVERELRISSNSGSQS